MIIFEDYKIIDNAFSDPYKIIDYAKRLPYREPYSDESWLGYRTNKLEEDYTVFARNEITPVITKALSIENLPATHYTVAYSMYSGFHQLPQSTSSKIGWHEDKELLAGVIYLHDDPPENSGTEFLINDEVVKFENIFNRLIVYKGAIKHRASSGFGDCIDTCRLTLTFFINEIHYHTVPQN
jgi:hypothetical protein